MLHFLGKLCALVDNLYSFFHFTLRYGSFLCFVGFWTFLPLFWLSYEHIFDSHQHPLGVMPMEGRKNIRISSKSSSWLVRGASHSLRCLSFWRGFLFSPKLFDFPAIIIPLLCVTVHQVYGRLCLWNESWVNLWHTSKTSEGVLQIFQKWGSTSPFSSIQSEVLAWKALWFLGGDQVWYRACDLVLLRKPSFPPNFEMYCALFGVVVDCRSYLWYATCDMLSLAYFLRLLCVWALVASSLTGFI